MVECSIRIIVNPNIREASGSNPDSSIIFFFHVYFSWCFVYYELFWVVDIKIETKLFLIIYFESILVIYIRDSIFITIILIVNTIIVQGMQSFCIEIPAWVEKITIFLGNNRFGKLFLTKHLVTSVKFENKIFNAI